MQEGLYGLYWNSRAFLVVTHSKGIFRDKIPNKFSEKVPFTITHFMFMLFMIWHPLYFDYSIHVNK